MQSNAISCVCLMGPTAVGKTDWALEWSDLLPVEIISIDSAMIYRDMDIGTAKPTSAILARVPHHLIDICDPTDTYSAAQCCADVFSCCQDIYQRGKIPLLVGGSMMYFRALQQGLSQLPAADSVLRASLLEQALQHGWPMMHRRLSEVDPISAQRIHPSDTQRIQRALEIYQTTGIPWSALCESKPNQHNLRWFNVVMLPESRAVLHARIAVRFKQMLGQGFLDEVVQLTHKWSLTLAHPSMRCVGYRQAFEYLNGAYNHEIFVEKGLAATRQLAKRQLTWLRNWPAAQMVFAHENKTILEDIKQFIDNR